MNWRKIDLNLFVVFDAIAQLRSTTRAAAKLNVSQPAVSHALTRLRTALKDDLFVRTPGGMEPTPYAEQLIGPVRAALETLGTALQSAAPFNPEVSSHRFSISADNRAALILAGPLAATVAAKAPSIKISIRPSGTLDIAECLDRGELDLALGSLAAPGERFSDLRLFEDRFAALVRRGHPAARDGVLSLEELGTYTHLTLSSTGEDTGFVDEVLARSGLQRRVEFSGPLLSAPALLVQSEMIAVMGERGAREFARSASLETLRLPFETPPLITAMLWHRRHDDVPAHRWLRSVVLRVARTIR